MKFDWNHAKAFLVTAQEGSLSAAALGMAQPTLGRQVDALEAELGVVLFERVGRGFTLTPSGVELLDHVRAMGEAANRVSLVAAGQSQAIEGTICIAASEVHAALLLPPILRKLRSAEPGIHVEIVASTSASDLRRREADIAIRNFAPTEPDLIAKRFATFQRAFMPRRDTSVRSASPSLPSDLRRGDFISIDRSGAFLKGLNALGMNLTERNFPIVAENYLVMWELVKHGLGIGILDGILGDAEPLVRRVLPDLEPVMFPIWLVSHREVNTSRRVRVVFDLLAAELASVR